MSAIKPITLQDGQSTPANHVFAPIAPQQNEKPAKWRNLNGPTLASARILTLRTLEKGNKFDVELRIQDPVPSSIVDGCCPTNLPAVAYTDIGSVSFSLAKGSTEAQRKDILAFLKAAIMSDMVTEAVVNIEAVW